MSRAIVGIDRAGNECHAIALFQMLAHSKAMSKRLWMHNLCFKKLFAEYVKTLKTSQTSTVPVSLGIEFRKYMFPSENPFQQQDSQAGLQMLFRELEQVSPGLALLNFNVYQKYQPVDIDPITTKLTDISVIEDSGIRMQSKHDWWMPIADIAAKSQLQTDNLIRSLFVEQCADDEPAVFLNGKGEKRRYRRQLTLKRLTKVPDALFIVPMRAVFNKETKTTIKDGTSVLDLPSTITLDSEYFASPLDQTPPVGFHLRSMVIHDGTARSGHFVAVVKSYIDNKWYFANDSVTTCLGNDPPLEYMDKAYLYYFEREDIVDTWPLTMHAVPVQNKQVCITQPAHAPAPAKVQSVVPIPLAQPHMLPPVSPKKQLQARRKQESSNLVRRPLLSPTRMIPDLPTLASAPVSVPVWSHAAASTLPAVSQSIPSSTQFSEQMKSMEIEPARVSRYANRRQPTQIRRTLAVEHVDTPVIQSYRVVNAHLESIIKQLQNITAACAC